MKTLSQWYNRTFPEFSDRRLAADSTLFVVGFVTLVTLIIVVLVFMFSPSPATQARELDECRALCTKVNTDFVFDAESLHCTCCTRGLQVTVPTHH